ncbi:MAG TPA: hypothetical protein PKM97_11315 [Bacteroidia bacterium]|nr:hypothetical protein [Bacteroidia bacterium]
MKKINLTLLVIAFLGLLSCSKNEKDTVSPSPAPSTTINVNSPSQYSIVFDGTTYSHIDGVQDFQESVGWSSSLATFPDTSSTTFSSGLENINSNIESFYIELGRVYFLGNEVDTSVFKSFLQTGARNYSVDPANGVSIGFTDPSGTYWSSSLGSANQNGSLFSITEYKALGMVLWSYQVKIKATFNCKVYDFNGNVKTVTDGVYVGVFENYF